MFGKLTGAVPVIIFSAFCLLVLPEISAGALKIETLPAITVSPGKNSNLNISEYIINSAQDRQLKVKIVPSRKNDQVKIVYNANKETLNISAVKSFRGVEIFRLAVSNSLKESVDAAIIIMAQNGQSGFAGISRKADAKAGQKKIALKYVPGVKGSKKMPLDITSILVLMDNKMLTGREYDCDMAGTRVYIRPPVSAGKHLFRIFAKDNSGSPVKPFSFVDGSDSGGNWEDKIIYTVMVDRFFNGGKSGSPVNDPSVDEFNNYQGGDLRGITEKIKSGYFSGIGVNAICLSPVADSTGYHGRWPVNFNAVEERFGTMKDLKELVAAAHSANIKILLEMVVNHAHKENPLYKQHPKWFTPQETRITEFLPEFDYQKNPDAVQYMTDNCLWWIEQSGCDGLSFGSVNYSSGDFWKELRKKIRERIETPSGKNFYIAGLDGMYDFLLCRAVRDAFGGKGSLENLERERKKSEEEFTLPGAIKPPLIGNCDFSRFIAHSDHNRQRMAIAFLLTLPGAPMVFYGDEFGMSEGSPKDISRKMRFDGELSPEEMKTLKFFSMAARVRKEHTAARYGKNYILALDKDTYIYLKQYFEDFVIVAMNLSDKAKDVQVELPGYLQFKKSLRDEFSLKKIPLINGRFNIKIQPAGCTILAG